MSDEPIVDAPRRLARSKAFARRRGHCATGALASARGAFAVSERV